MSRCLITGASGFVGLFLSESLRSPLMEVYGFDLRHPPQVKQAFTGEITNRADVLSVLRQVQPDIIFHLAGILKSQSPEDLYNVNVLGTVALFEAIMESGLRPRVIVAGSSAVYGTGGDTPISEDLPVQPITHYAASKLSQEIVALRYHKAFDLPVICVRTFNLLGPGLSPDMAPSAFAKQIAQAERMGGPAKIFTGDLSAQRDYVDVRDAVRAYTLIAEHGEAGQTYNVCSGRAISMSEILQILLDQAQVQMEAVLDPDRVQKQDVPVQIGSAKKIQQLTGWKTEINITKSLTDLLNDWREKINLENVK